MAEKQYGVRGPDPRNTVQKFPDEDAAREALADWPTDVLMVSEDGGRTWQEPAESAGQSSAEGQSWAEMNGDEPW